MNKLGYISNLKQTEPFISAKILSKESAFYIIEKNIYYVYVFASIFLALFLISVEKQNSFSGNYEFLIISILYFILAYWIKQTFSKFATIILIILTIIVLVVYILIVVFLTQNIGLEVIVIVTMLKSIQRLKKAVFFYNENLLN